MLLQFNVTAAFDLEVPLMLLYVISLIWIREAVCKEKKRKRVMDYTVSSMIKVEKAY